MLVNPGGRTPGPMLWNGAAQPFKMKHSRTKFKSKNKKGINFALLCEVALGLASKRLQGQQQRPRGTDCPSSPTGSGAEIGPHCHLWRGTPPLRARGRRPPRMTLPPADLHLFKGELSQITISIRSLFLFGCRKIHGNNDLPSEGWGGVQHCGNHAVDSGGSYSCVHCSHADQWGHFPKSPNLPREARSMKIYKKCLNFKYWDRAVMWKSTFFLDSEGQRMWADYIVGQFWHWDAQLTDTGIHRMAKNTEKKLLWFHFKNKSRINSQNIFVLWFNRDWRKKRDLFTTYPQPFWLS